MTGGRLTNGSGPLLGFLRLLKIQSRQFRLVNLGLMIAQVVQPIHSRWAANNPATVYPLPSSGVIPNSSLKKSNSGGFSNGSSSIRS